MSDESPRNNPSGDDRAIDLTALDLARDGPRFDAIVRSIAAEAMTERRRDRYGVWSAVAPVVAWSRPMLAAAAVILIVAGSALVIIPPPTGDDATSLVEPAGLPAPLVDLATNGRAVTATELVDAFDQATLRRLP